jgi:hypothetical protein
MLTVDFNRPLVEQFGDTAEVRQLQETLDNALPFEERAVKNYIVSRLLEHYVGISVNPVIN